MMILLLFTCWSNAQKKVWKLRGRNTPFIPLKSKDALAHTAPRQSFLSFSSRLAQHRQSGFAHISLRHSGRLRLPFSYVRHRFHAHLWICPYWASQPSRPDFYLFLDLKREKSEDQGEEFWRSCIPNPPATPRNAPFLRDPQFSLLDAPYSPIHNDQKLRSSPHQAISWSEKKPKTYLPHRAPKPDRASPHSHRHNSHWDILP